MSNYQGEGQPYEGASAPTGAPYQGGEVPPSETHQFPPAGQQPQWQGQPGYQNQPNQGYPGSQRSRRNLSVRSTFKTTEFWTMVVVAIGILIAAAVTDQGDDGQGFSAQEAWKYVTALAIAYIVSRGLTKLAGHEHGDHDHHDHHDH